MNKTPEERWKEVNGGKQCTGIRKDIHKYICDCTEEKCPRVESVIEYFVKIIESLKLVKSQKCRNCGGDGSSDCMGGADWQTVDAHNAPLDSLQAKIKS